MKRNLALDVSVQSTNSLVARRDEKDLGVTYVFISHDLAVVEQLCPNVLVMYAVRLLKVVQHASFLASQTSLHRFADQKCSVLWKIFAKSEEKADLENPGGCAFRNRCPKANQQCSRVPNLREVRGSIGAHECACHYPLSEAA